jgi:hypothetical protein
MEGPFADSLASVFLGLNLKEGESRQMALPVGAFTVPWIPEGAVLSFVPKNVSNSIPVPLDKVGSFYRSPNLAAGTYTVSLSSPYPYSQQITVEAGKTVELPQYRALLASAMQTEQDTYRAQKRAKSTKIGLGWATLSVGLVSSGGAIASYILGSQISSTYTSAQSTSQALSSRNQLQFYGTLLPITAVVGALGIGITPVLWSGGPDPVALQGSMDALEGSLKKLRE